MSYSQLMVLSLAAVLALSCTGCKKKDAGSKEKVLKVKVLEIERTNAPVVFEFVGQAQSSRQVEIRARVDGFLDTIAYTEGAMVDPNQTLFILDKKPFQAALQQAEGELALQVARLETATLNLNRIRPLAKLDALSQKDLDDAVGRQKEAEASVLAAEGSVREAQLNLSYATIESPLKGLASKSRLQEGSYVPTGPDSLLTYVAQLDPIWINFSVSENQILYVKDQEKKGLLIPPHNDEYEVEAVFADGSSFPKRGSINFAEPNIDPITGTFLIRAQLRNPKGTMRPGQFLRVRLHGAERPNAILVPQKAVQLGAKGHFVWVVDKDDKPQVRSVMLGPWQGENWFVDEGLNDGDRVIVDNIMRLNPEVKLNIVE